VPDDAGDADRGVLIAAVGIIRVQDVGGYQIDTCFGPQPAYGRVFFRSVDTCGLRFQLNGSSSSQTPTHKRDLASDPGTAR